MGFRINTNIPSINARNNLRRTSDRLARDFDQLSSGRRINRAADDAAGLAIGEKLKASVRSTQQAERNAGDAISLIQTAEGGMSEISDILTRLRELAVQAANDTIGDNERQFSNLEFQSLKEEIDRIANSTRFDSQPLLNGTGEKLDFQVGIDHQDISRLSYNISDVNLTIDALELSSSNVSSKENSRSNLEKIDQALTGVSSNRALLGALQNRLTATINNLQTQHESMATTKSRIMDTDVAQATADLIKDQTLTQTGISVLREANLNPQIAIVLIS